MSVASPKPGHVLFQAVSSVNSLGSPAMIPNLIAGFPSNESTVPMMLNLQKAGASIIQISVPFGESSGEGYEAQKSHAIAISNGIRSLEHTFKIVKDARAAGVTVPVILKAAMNLVLAYSSDYRLVAKEACECGVSGFVVPDLLPEEAEEFFQVLSDFQISFIPVVTMNSSTRRIQEVLAFTSSLLFVVCPMKLTPNDLKEFEEDAERSNFTFSRISQILRQFPHVKVILQSEVETNDDLKVVFGNSSGPDGIVLKSSLLTPLVMGEASSSNEVQQSTLLSSYKSLTENIVYHQPNMSQSTETVSQTTSGALIHAKDQPISFQASHYGAFGGVFVPEPLIGALRELSFQFDQLKVDPSFIEECLSYNSYLGRPSSFHRADRLSHACGGASIWLKREDLNHTGSHKINNALGQILLAKRLGKTRVIAETGAGQHGVATATICSKFALDLTVYMGEEDVRRQSLNVFRMQLLGAKVVAVKSGTRTLKDAVDEALKDWVQNLETTHYCVGSAIGPHPFPAIVKHFQRVISQESMAQFQEHTSPTSYPDAVVACIGGGSNAIGSFAEYLDVPSVQLVGVEAAGHGTGTEKHSATLTMGTMGVLHGTKTILLQDKNGQVLNTHSISAGLDYPGIGPEHAHLLTSGRARYAAVTDKQALEGFLLLSRLEGIMPALETSHAVYHTIELARSLPKDQNIILTVSGRGDKDVQTVTESISTYFPEGIPDTLAGISLSIYDDGIETGTGHVEEEKSKSE